MRQVQSRIDKGGDLARGRLDDDAPGRRRPHVARADRSGRVDDDRRQAALGHQFFDHALGQHLAALVGADGLVRAQRRGLVHRRPRAGHAQRRHAAGIDHPLDAGLLRGLHHGQGAVDVSAHDLLGVRRPQPVVGGHMEQVAHALQRGSHRAGVAHVAFRHAHRQPGQVGARALRAHQHAHPEAACQRPARHRRAQKARGACHQHVIVFRHKPVFP
ncbi:hypothetical protein D3C72_1614910 [compost metagenome]